MGMHVVLLDLALLDVKLGVGLDAGLDVGFPLGVGLDVVLAVLRSDHDSTLWCFG